MRGLWRRAGPVPARSARRDAVVAGRATRRTCRRGRSTPPPLLLVVVPAIEVDGAEQIHDLPLFAPSDVLDERLRHGCLLGLVASYAECLIEDPIIDRQVGRHV